jgi:DNA-binding NtrC family response regulator
MFRRVFLYLKCQTQENHYNMTRTSEQLGISRRQLFNKIEEYNR